MKLIKEIHKKESGQVFILALILLLVGGLIIAPLLSYMSSGLIVGQTYEQKMDEVYAADAGAEDAIFNIIYPGAPYYDDLQGLDEGESLDQYTLTSQVNGHTVNVAIKKLSLMQGLIGEDEYRTDRPHEDWIDFTVPEDEITRNYDEGWVEYTCHITIVYDDGGQCTLESVGAFFFPYTGDQSLVDGPYGYEGTEFGAMDFTDLLEGSPETKFTSGGFAFIWRWEKSPPAIKFNADLGFSFQFKVHDPYWEYSLYFVWAVVTRQDIAFVTNAPGLYKWIIETSAGGTDVKTVVLEQIDSLYILTWESSLQQE